MVTFLQVCKGHVFTELAFSVREFKVPSACDKVMKEYLMRSGIKEKVKMVQEQGKPLRMTWHSVYRRFIPRASGALSSTLWRGSIYTAL